MKYHYNIIAHCTVIISVYILNISCSAQACFCHCTENINIFSIIDNPLSAEEYVQDHNCNLDSSSHQVLCIGNSITLHLPKEEINWLSCQGMAASKPEYDYVHILEKMIKSHNSESTVTPVILVSWERNFSVNIDSLLKDKCAGKDIIVIRIGENVPSSNVALFEYALSKLIKYCKQYTSNIILTGEYWPNTQIERSIVNCAQKFNLKYVPIYWIWSLYQEEASPKEGDILYDTDGKPYRIKGNFIITHPNDKGMVFIAKSIYNFL